VDRADACGSRKGVERKELIQPDRQDQHRKHPSTGMGKGAKKRRGLSSAPEQFSSNFEILI